MINNPYDADEYGRMLAALALAKPIKEKMALFTTSRGSNWDQQLMVCGRATNGSDDFRAWEQKDILDKAGRDDAIEQMHAKSYDMEWVCDLWNARGADENGNKLYNTATSAFWRVSRRVRETIVGPERTGTKWSTYLSWTNLYRIAPVAQKNPSTRLQRVQREFCSRLLQGDLAHLQPKRLLLMTGRSWSDEVLPQHGINWTSHASTLIEGAGHWQYSEGLSAQLVVAKHPQGKREDLFVSEVCSAFAAVA